MENIQEYPLFEKLHILRASLLCSVRDRAFAGLPLLFEEYSDGIISGCRLSTTKSTVTLNPGLVKHGGYLFYIEQSMTVPYEPTEEYCALRLRFGDAVKDDKKGVITRQVSLFRTADMELMTDEMELCRFKLKRGSILRVNYTDFFDRTTEFDTVNNIYAPYAAVGQSTLSPDITKAFANEVKNYTLTELDRQFCLSALNGQPLSVETIGFYISQRLQQEEQAWDNASLFDGLTRVLDEIRPAGLRQCRRERRRRREVFVD